MPARLDTLPDVIVEAIVELLPLDDIRSLRLTCASLAVKASYFHFRTFFQSKHADITVDSLKALAAGCLVGGLTSLVQHICLTGIAADGKVRPRLAENDPREEELRLLTEAFKGVAKNRDTPLRSLTLRVAVLDEAGRPLSHLDPKRKDPKNLWQCTNQTYEMVLRALMESGLQIEGLNIFNDTDLQRCSLASNQLWRVDLGDKALAHSLAPLKTLLISLCTPGFRFAKVEDVEEDDEDDRLIYADESEDDEGDEDNEPDGIENARTVEQPDDEANVTGVAQLLALTPQLRTLELHLLSLQRRGREALPGFPAENILQHVTKLDTLPTLQKLVLGGMRAWDHDILDIIKRIKLQGLSLINVTILGSQHRQLLDYCFGKGTPLKTIQIDNVHVSGTDGSSDGRLFFIGEGYRRVIWYELQGHNEILQREGENMTDPITYVVSNPRYMGSPVNYAWREARRMEYGSV